MIGDWKRVGNPNIGKFNVKFILTVLSKTEFPNKVISMLHLI